MQIRSIIFLVNISFARILGDMIRGRIHDVDEETLNGRGKTRHKL